MWKDCTLVRQRNAPLHHPSSPVIYGTFHKGKKEIPIFLLPPLLFTRVLFCRDVRRLFIFKDAAPQSVPRDMTEQPFTTTHNRFSKSSVSGPGAISAAPRRISAAILSPL